MFKQHTVHFVTKALKLKQSPCLC